MNRKRIIIDVNVDLHSEAKQRAAARNVSLKKWVTRAIMEQIRKEQRYEKSSS